MKQLLVLLVLTPFFTVTLPSAPLASAPLASPLISPHASPHASPLASAPQDSPTPVRGETLAVLPLSGNGVDRVTLESVLMLLRTEIDRLGAHTLIAESDVRAALGDSECATSDCAADIARRSGASRAVAGSLNRLGEKILFHYMLVDAASGQILVADQMTAARVEELDQIAKRVALSLVHQVPAARTVEVGLVTEQESLEQNTRKSRASWGIGWGYLFPQQGYDDESRVFVWDFRSIYEIQNFAVDAFLGVRKGAALNIGMLYVPGKTDLSPFLGAGFGFHDVDHETSYGYNGEWGDRDKKGDAFELVLKGGLIGFRTYDFRVLGTVEYDISLNDYDDSAIVLTFGMMHAGKRIFGIF